MSKIHTYLVQSAKSIRIITISAKSIVQLIQHNASIVLPKSLVQLKQPALKFITTQYSHAMNIQLTLGFQLTNPNIKQWLTFYITKILNLINQLRNHQHSPNP